MAITISGNDKGLPSSAWRSGAPIQSAWGYNISSASKIFGEYGRWEEVPGRLECTLTPSGLNNIVVVTVHLAWGGWNRSSTTVGTESGTDVALNFRIFKDTGSGPQNFGTYASPEFDPPNNTGGGVATGTYKYNQGDNNSSWDSDDILMYDTVSSLNQTRYALFWNCGYSPSRTLYWNKAINHLGQNSYNPVHTCMISAIEYKA